MPVVNIGLQRQRDRVIAGAAGVVDSIGFGSDDAAEAAANTKLGAGTAPKNKSYWKTSTDVTQTTGGDATADPWWQFEATWDTTQANDTLFELGTSAGGLTGTDPGGNNNTNLYSRKRIGGAAGIGKTTDISLVGRVKITY